MTVTFGYKDQFDTEYVRNIELMSLFSKSCILSDLFKTALHICNDSVYA